MAIVNLIKNMFKGRQTSKLLKINHSSFLQKDFEFPLISKKHISGVIIENFLNKNEIENIIQNIQSYPKLSSQAKGYFVFPPTCFHPDLLDDLQTKYHNNVDVWEAEITSICQFNLKNRLVGIFNKLDGNLKVLPLYGKEKNERFLFGNFRVMYEETGNNATSNIHTGHALTIRSKDYAYKHLMHDIDFDNQLSYFILLQKSEIGGEITLYEYTYNDYPTVNQEGVFYDKNKTSFKPKDKEIHKYKLNPGDLIVFKGGNIYHRVELVKGNMPRITFGGFLASDFKKENVYYWI